MPKKLKTLLMDSNVLIDYQKSNLDVLKLVNKYVSEVYVLTTTFEEVEGFNANTCKQLGLKTVEPELRQVELATNKRGQLSFYDHLNLLVASDSGFVCVTNDKRLRKACTEEGVDILWGLEIMEALVRKDKMRAVDAIQTAEKIHLSNPWHISRELVNRFTINLDPDRML